MAERSFKQEVKKLRLGAGQEFRGEGILAVTKALLQSGVSYVSGYQGAPISHLLDVLADADDVLAELGIRFEAIRSRPSYLTLHAPCEPFGFPTRRAALHIDDFAVAEGQYLVADLPATIGTHPLA